MVDMSENIETLVDVSPSKSGEPEGRNRGNSRNGKRAKTVITDNAGPVQIEVPRDRESIFEPVIVGKRQRRLSDLDQVVLSLSAKGLTTGEISAHPGEVYGADVSRDTVTRITDRVIEEMQAWWARPLEQVYTAVFIDAIMEGPRRAGPQPARVRGDRGGPGRTQGHRRACGPGTATGRARSSGTPCSTT